MIPRNAADNYIINQEENFYNFAIRTLTRYGMPAQIAAAIAGPLATWIGSRALEQARTTITDVNTYINEQTAGLSAYATGNLQNIANDIFDQIEDIRTQIHNDIENQRQIQEQYQQEMQTWINTPLERANNQLAMQNEDRLANIQRELGASEQVFNGKLISQFTLNYTDV